MEDVAKFFFGISGNVIALFLFLSPVPTFWRIIRNKSTEEFSGVPYNMTLLNCLLSAWYGLPFVSPNNVLVSTINGVGAAIETVYVVIFLVFASSRKARLRTLGLASAVAAVFAVVALVSMLALHGRARKLLAGLAMTVFSICMYASPLSIMRMVIKTKSVEYMPFLLSLAVFLCGTSWFIYGLLGHDLFVTIPNGCGSVLGAAQLILYAVYRNNKGNAAAGAGKMQGDDVEMSVDGRNNKVADGDDSGARESKKAGKMVSQV
ncbi:Protein RUPTURED POLLEN GRAIN 1 [Hordeum vulgare]|uniref:Bidirectional sugar transporter SWEET n=1 Tax=Hordeum vulgare subsp. vulgare TaxID=112509 RepID=A0A8I6X4K4_HORVV|nr:bidirectional sugar transporter SWEET1b-like [Hordeum vulgare subsp. vulgare]KAE8820047.1 Protein RUPTURED POLLEN GRAIN 1 [Hordeum vulgare]